MSDEASRIYGFIFISKANSICFRKAHIILIVTGFLPIPDHGLLSSRHAIFSSSQKIFRSHLTIVKCTFAMWLLNVCLITREISEEMVDCEFSLFYSRICKLFARIRAFSTPALATRATLLLKYSCLKIFEQKRDCS